MILFSNDCLLLDSPSLLPEGSSPYFREEPVNTYAPLDQLTRIRCIVGGNPLPNITWLKDNATLKNVDKPIATQMLMHLNEITFTKLQPRHEGVYQCLATNIFGKKLSKEAEVRVAYLSSQFRTHPQSKTASVGEPVQLACEAPDGIPRPTITWKKDGTILPINTRNEEDESSIYSKYSTGVSHYQLVEQSHLRIPSARLEDTGRYQCVASNMASTRESDVAHLTVRKKPYFLVVPHHQTVPLNATVLFPCQVQAEPKAMILWRRADKPEGYQNNRWRIQEDNSLELVGVQLADAGDYICEATNSVAQIEAVARLNVTAQPSFLQTPEDRQVLWGTDVIFSCKATGNPPPYVRWLHNNQYYLNQSDSHANSDRIRVLPDNRLRIQQARLSDSGRYLCIASSHLGTVKSSAILQVQPLPPGEDSYRIPFIIWPPQKFERIPISTSRLQSYSRLLTCQAWMPAKDENYPLGEESQVIVYSLQWTFQHPSYSKLKSLRLTNSGDYIIRQTEVEGATKEFLSSSGDYMDRSPKLIRYNSVLQILQFDPQKHAGIYTCQLEQRFLASTMSSLLAQWSVEVSISDSLDDMVEPDALAPTPIGGITVTPSDEPTELLVSLANVTFVSAGGKDVEIGGNLPFTSPKRLAGFYIQFAPMKNWPPISMLMDRRRGVFAQPSSRNNLSPPWKNHWVEASSNGTVVLKNLTANTGYYVLVHSVLSNGYVSSAYIYPEAVFTQSEHPLLLFSSPQNEDAYIGYVKNSLRYDEVKLQPLSATELLVEWSMQAERTLQVKAGFSVRYRAVSLQQCRTPQHGQKEAAWIERNKAYCSLQMEGINWSSKTPLTKEWEQHFVFSPNQPWNVTYTAHRNSFVKKNHLLVLPHMRPFHCYEVQVTPFVELPRRSRVFLNSLPGNSLSIPSTSSEDFPNDNKESSRRQIPGIRDEIPSKSTHALTYESAPSSSPQQVRAIWWTEPSSSPITPKTLIKFTRNGNPILNVSWSPLPIEERNGRLIDFWVYVLQSGFSANTSQLIKVPAYLTSISVHHLLTPWINETLTRQENSMKNVRKEPSDGWVETNPTVQQKRNRRSSNEAASPVFIIFVSATTCHGEGIRSPGLLVQPPTEIFISLGLPPPTAAAQREFPSEINGSNNATHSWFLPVLLGVPALWLFLSVALLYVCLTRRRRKRTDKDHLRFKQQASDRNHHQHLLLSHDNDNPLKGFTNPKYFFNSQHQPQLLNSCHFPLLAATEPATSPLTPSPNTLFMPPAPNKQLPPIPVNGDTYSPAMRFTTLEKKRGSNNGTSCLASTVSNNNLTPISMSNNPSSGKLESTPFVSPYASTTLLKGLPSGVNGAVPPHSLNLSSLIPPPPEYPPPSGTIQLSNLQNPAPPNQIYPPNEGMMWMPPTYCELPQSSGFPISADMSYLHDDQTGALGLMMMQASHAPPGGFHPAPTWYGASQPSQMDPNLFNPMALPMEEEEDVNTGSQSTTHSNPSGSLSEVAEEEDMHDGAHIFLPEAESLEGASLNNFDRRPSAQLTSDYPCNSNTPFAYASHSLRLPVDRRNRSQTQKTFEDSPSQQSRNRKGHPTNSSHLPLPPSVLLVPHKTRRKRRTKRRPTAPELERRQQSPSTASCSDNEVGPCRNNRLHSLNSVQAHSESSDILLPTPQRVIGFESEDSQPASSVESEENRPRFSPSQRSPSPQAILKKVNGAVARNSSGTISSMYGQ